MLLKTIRERPRLQARTLRRQWRTWEWTQKWKFSFGGKMLPTVRVCVHVRLTKKTSLYNDTVVFKADSLFIIVYMLLQWILEKKLTKLKM